MSILAVPIVRSSSFFAVLEKYLDGCKCIQTELQCVHLNLDTVPQASWNVTSL